MLNALDASNNFQFNITAAQILGLNNAIYCSELINVYQKAKKKKRLYDDFFVLNRAYVAHRTTLSVDAQYECDSALSKVGVVEVSKDSPDKLRFNYDAFAQIVTGEDCNFIKEIASKARKPSASDVKEAKKRKIVEALKAKVSSGNASIDEALRHWVEVTCEKTYMSCDTVMDFQKVLMQYSKVDVSKAMRVVEIATSQAWTSCTQAIASYEKEQEVLSKSLGQPRVSRIRRGSSVNLSDEVY